MWGYFFGNDVCNNMNYPRGMTDSTYNFNNLRDNIRAMMVIDKYNKNLQMLLDVVPVAKNFYFNEEYKVVTRADWIYDIHENQRSLRYLVEFNDPTKRAGIAFSKNNEAFLLSVLREFNLLK